MAGADGTVYWPDGIWLNPVNYSNKGDKTTGDIRQPTLVVLTWQGGTIYQYSGIRLE